MESGTRGSKGRGDGNRSRRGGGGGDRNKNNHRNESSEASDNNGPATNSNGSSIGTGKNPRNQNPKKGRGGKKTQQSGDSQSKDSQKAAVAPGANADNRSNQENRHGGRGRNHKQLQSENTVYPKHWNLKVCLERYNQKDPNLIRGTLRVLPAKEAASFCTCDRGSQAKDVLIEAPLQRNRALDGDQVFIELLPLDIDGEEADKGGDDQGTSPPESEPPVVEETPEVAVDEVQECWWQDDEVQVSLWDPVVPIQRKEGIPKDTSDGTDNQLQQRRGRVVHVVPPKAFGSEINPTQSTFPSFRRVVGTLKRLQSGTALLTSANKSLSQFRLNNVDAEQFKDCPDDAIFSAKYAYGSWMPNFKWPPCVEVVQFGLSCNVQDETMALLIDNQVDHGEFSTSVLEECQQVVASGEYSNGEESGWKPTPEMYAGRRDYRKQRIFTIDPTTAKDLDDALHIAELDNGQIEIGVHIADVSYFIQPDSQIDLEAQRRCTTVYLVDRTIPMLPRPLCEIACSLNENVERLAFSCVWRMNRDGSLVKGHTVWYGKTVIKSCARLDYATAQNIIDRKVADSENEIDQDLWPLSRRPTGGHTIDQVAADVRLMHEIGMARRALRFRNGAVALSAVKLTFQLDSDRETPLLCEPYPIRDSNRLVEEYMLLANFLVAQREITHARGKALLRNHEPPLVEGLEKVVEMAQESIGFRMDISSSEALQKSLNRLGRECQDELVLQCVTEMLKLPMRPANYVAAGSLSNEEWSHFALNIPYYTHFTSPIRRYADVVVHRILQATIEGEAAVDDFVLSEKDIQVISERCNDKKEGSRKAQDRSDIVFLALYLRRNPMKSQMGVVLSVGQKTFTVFIPSLGVSALLFLDEHKTWVKSLPLEENAIMGRRIKLERIATHKGEHWQELMIKNFTKIRVICKCQDKPPINVKLELEGPWTAGES